jgi:hypothetical protein
VDIFLVLCYQDLTYEKEEKQNTHYAATKFKFLYKINQRNNQSKILLMDGPGL